MEEKNKFLEDMFQETDEDTKKKFKELRGIDELEKIQSMEDSDKRDRYLFVKKNFIYFNHIPKDVKEKYLNDGGVFIIVEKYIIPYSHQFNFDSYNIYIGDFESFVYYYIPINKNIKTESNDIAEKL